MANGTKEILESNQTISVWLEQKGVEPMMVAVEHNGKILQNDEYGQVIIRDGDIIEVVRFMSGG